MSNIPDAVHRVIPGDAVHRVIPGDAVHRVIPGDAVHRVAKHDSLFDSLTADAAEQARQQLLYLEENLTGLRGSSDDSALLDELYRAAHALLIAADEDRIPPIVSLVARLLQNVVQATRTGAVTVKPELGSLLASVVRITRETLERSGTGKTEPSSAESAIAALQAVLARKDEWEYAPALGDAQRRFTRVDAQRLRAAEAAVRNAGEVNAAFSRAAENIESVAAQFHELLETQGKAARELREALPRSLAAAARGEPTTELAAELAAAIAPIEGLSEGFGSAIDRCASVVRETAENGARTEDSVRRAFFRLERVSLAALMDDLPRRVHRYSRANDLPVSVTAEPGDLEIDAIHVDLLRTALGNGIRAFLVPAPFSGQKLKRSESSKERMLSIIAREEKDTLQVRLLWEGDEVDEAHVKRTLAGVNRRFDQAGGSIHIDCGAKNRAVILMTLPSSQEPLKKEASEFIVARAGSRFFAIPSAFVVECIEAAAAQTGYSLAGRKIRALTLGSAERPGAGIVVRIGARGVILLADAVEGREMLLPVPLERAKGGTAGVTGTAARKDGTTAHVVDAAALLSTNRSRRRRRATPRPSRKEISRS